MEEVGDGNCWFLFFIIIIVTVVARCAVVVYVGRGLLTCPYDCGRRELLELNIVSRAK